MGSGNDCVEYFLPSLRLVVCLSIHNTIELMRTDHNNRSLNDRLAKIGQRGKNVYEVLVFLLFFILERQIDSLSIAPDPISSHHYQSLFCLRLLMLLLIFSRGTLLKNRFESRNHFLIEKYIKLWLQLLM